MPAGTIRADVAVMDGGLALAKNDALVARAQELASEVTARPQLGPPRDELLGLIAEASR